MLIMHRFTMPSSELRLSDQVAAIRFQLDSFIKSDALRELLILINADRNTIKDKYNGRLSPDGRVLETQAIGSSDALEAIRFELYPLLKELGFFDINEPISDGHRRIIVLGGSLNVCRLRTEYASRIINSRTVSVDGLTCYRPINPVERKKSVFASAAETEFGVLAESFKDVFDLDVFEDDFVSDRNLNSISCVRSFAGGTNNCAYNIYAAPSSDPQLRRADTGDAFRFYLDKSDISTDDSLLILTSNRYCNRQFIQLAYQLMVSRRSVSFDIIGTTPHSDIVTPETFDPFQYIQDLIGILDWIDRFRSYREFYE